MCVRSVRGGERVGNRELQGSAGEASPATSAAEQQQECPGRDPDEAEPDDPNVRARCLWDGRHDRYVELDRGRVDGGTITNCTYIRINPCMMGDMCRRVTCSTCDKPSWAGCGAHVDAVLGDVPVDERCRCEAASTAGGGSGLLARALGRR